MHFLKTLASCMRHRHALFLTLLCLAAMHQVMAADNTKIGTTRIKYEVQVEDGIESVKQALISALEAKNYMVINVLNVQEALRGRGIKTKSVQLIEFCNLVQAYAVSRTTHEFELFAPCRMALFESAGKTTVMVLRPSFIATVLPQETLSKEGRDAMQEFDRDVRIILNNLARGDF